MSKKLNLVGETYGRLLVLEEVEPTIKPSGQKVRRYKCKCECGSEPIVRQGDLRSGHTKSCGCLHKENASKKNTTHGQTKNKKWTPEYTCWMNIKQRCLNTSHEHYDRYGRRGITMYAEWIDNAEAFCKYVLDTLGPRPSKKHSIDRINNDGDYEPGNIRWATKAKQGQNNSRTVLTPDLVRELRSLKPNHTYKELASMYNLNTHTVRNAIVGHSWKNVI